MAKQDYSKYQVQVPMREVAANLQVKGVSVPTRTYMSNKLVPGCNMYVEYSWIYQMPEPAEVVPAVHAHSYEQVTMMIGTDPDNPEDLGGEVEFEMGGQKMATSRTNALYIPSNVAHGHVTWKRVTRPHILMSITVGTGDILTANPGGYNKK
jgi:hypothetical protein